jgi:hypothetical protein
VLATAVVTLSTAQEPKSANQPRFESPEACHKACLEATRHKDYVALLPCLSEAHANFILGETAFRLSSYDSPILGGPSGAKRAAQAVLEKYGLHRVSVTDFLVMADSRAENGMTIGLMQIGNSIRDKTAFVREAAAAKKTIEQEMRKFGMPVPADEVANSEDPTLINVEIMGDKAKGMLKLADSDETGPLFFVRENDSWRMKLSEIEPDWKRPIPGVSQLLDLLNKNP